MNRKRKRSEGKREGTFVGQMARAVDEEEDNDYYTDDTQETLKHLQNLFKSIKSIGSKQA